MLSSDQATELKQRYANRKVQQWKPAPGKASIDGRPDADLIRYSIQVLDKTVKTIDPRVAEAGKLYSGNRLNCSSCQLKGAAPPGTKVFAIPFNNIVNDYPNFRTRNMSIGTSADRVNGCMTRSTGNGKPLPLDSREMKGILTYFTWLSEGVEKEMAMNGTGIPEIKLPDSVADPEKGKLIYASSCQSFHAADGLGTRLSDVTGLVPTCFHHLQAMIHSTMVQT